MGDIAQPHAQRPDAAPAGDLPSFGSPAAKPRSERCCCGGVLTVRDGSDHEITAVVQYHQRTPQHVAWRLGMRMVRDRRTSGRDGMGVAEMEETA